MMKVYFISGLGADRRVFKNIRLPDGFEAVYLDWIQPLQEESLKDYALRLAKGIELNQPFILIGLSMGGMVASQIAVLCKPVTTILISSIPSADDLPTYFAGAGKLKLHKIVPIRLIRSGTVIKHLFTTKSPKDSLLLRNMAQDSNPDFIRWAMGAIIGWQNKQLPEPYIHLHGTADNVLPIRYTHPTHVIKKGGHVMILNRSAEINTILADYLITFKINGVR